MFALRCRQPDIVATILSSVSSRSRIIVNGVVIVDNYCQCPCYWHSIMLVPSSAGVSPYISLKKEKTLQASYDRDTQINDYMD